MNIDQIAQALAKCATSQNAHEIRLAIERQQAEIRTRLEEISPVNDPQFPHPAQRLAAIRAGLEAVRKLDLEVEDLSRKLDYLAELHRMVYARVDELSTAEARAAVPANLKRLPAIMRTVRETMDAYDRAVSALDTALQAINQFDRVGLPYPFDDAQLFEVLKLREEIWRVRTVFVPANWQVEDRQKFPQSWPLMFAVHEHGAFHVRRPPQPHTWPDADPIISGSAGRE
ncbi:MAG: hypothetical protein IRZ28_01475 [Steroidobacteraceae bacterium]|nr:hypothetical protein [Steroidobacteraceae bacterium]